MQRIVVHECRDRALGRKQMGGMRNGVQNRLGTDRCKLRGCGLAIKSYRSIHNAKNAMGFYQSGPLLYRPKPNFVGQRLLTIS